MSRRIELHIDELILHGVAPNDAGQVGQAVEQELTRLLSLHGLPSSLSAARELEMLDGGRFAMTVHARPSSIGNQVAGSVFKGMVKSKEPVRQVSPDGPSTKSGGPSIKS
jgi:hypothetical protein